MTTQSRGNEQMGKKVHWVDVLNEQATWTSYEDAQQWLAKITPQKMESDLKSVEKFNDLLNLMRSQVFAIHFSEPLDLPAINEHLRGIHAQLHEHPDGSKLPALLADFSSHTDFASSLSATLLLQFAQFIGEWMSDPLSAAIGRCEGLYREPGATTLSPVPHVSSDIELKWRKEISILDQAGLAESPDVLRCADLFIARKGRFCSDDCRFRTFQIAKQLSEPNYLAEKQRRYRNRKK